MDNPRANGDSEKRLRLSRRDLLRAVAATTFGALAGGPASATQQAASRPAVPRPWWMDRHGPRARVVDVRSNNVVRSAVANRAVLGELLSHGILGLTGAPESGEAWRAVLGSAQRIAIKFNSVGAPAINTTDAMARSLVGALSAAGYARQRIQLIEAPEYLQSQLETRKMERAERGWGAPIPVGGRAEQVANWVYWADAIINVPFLKTHKIAGMSGCLKNISHAVIRRPAQYHANGCSPYVGQVISAESVSSRLKLQVVNAIRIVVNRGPEAAEEDIVAYGGLLLGYDPVAVDDVGHELLSYERRRAGFSGGISVPSLEWSWRAGIGRRGPREVDRLMLETGS